MCVSVSYPSFLAGCSNSCQ
uniref:Uncharacterized protein n=1 Tax=Anguilla anguilla TaxID=7936 RepID=A0A0E9V264_ANGAN